MPERAATCSHCGLALARKTGAEHAYCCLGCEVAAALARGGGMTAGPLLARLGLATFLSMNVMMIAFALWGAAPGDRPVSGWASLLRWLSLLLSVPALMLLLPPLAKAGFARVSSRAPRVELLVVAASLAAFVVSAVHTVRERGEVWFDGATMVPLVVLIGSWLAARARSRARDDVERLFAAQPATCRVRRGGVAADVAEVDLRAGDEIELAPGARVPADGVVVAAVGARLDTALLTGEPLPRGAVAGARLRAGENLVAGTLVLRAERVGDDATLGRLRAALARALAHPPATVRAVDGAGRLLVAATATLALAVVALSIVRGAPDEGLRRALALLVVACPCSIGLAAPLALTRALGAAARLGAVVQSLDGFEQLARADVVAADKTGTLTQGDPAALAPEIETLEGASRDGARTAAAALARVSTHPLALALRAATADAPRLELVASEEIAGQGVRATTRDGRELRLGRPGFAAPGANDAGDEGTPADGTLESLLSIDGQPVARVRWREVPRPGAADLGARLRERGVELVVLSGDLDARTRKLAESLGAHGRGGLDPERKAAELDALARAGRTVAWLGDGANDALALARAPVSIVVDRRLEWLALAADVVLLGERLGALPELIDLARRARRRIRIALAWAAAYHAVALTLGATGRLTPASAALWMAVGSLAVVNASLRPLDAPPPAERAPAPLALPRPEGVATP
ncbi:MAG TPA: heavy metal translocating P-type ATPase [Planctomycetota bacterium]|nr:heavy metal translocating P-type ATPase [Planctomycetota bacterium]